MLTLKQKLLQEKAAKHRIAAKRMLATAGGASRVFSAFHTHPTEDQFADMCAASKYGPGDPLFAGGSEFALAAIENELKSAIVDFKTNGELQPGRDLYQTDGMSINVPERFTSSERGSLDSDDFYRFTSVAPHFWGNIILVCVFNKALLEHMDGLVLSDYKLDKDRGLYVERESGAIGVRIIVQTMLPLSDYPLRPEDGHGAAPHKLKSNEHFSQYIIQVGLVEDFDAILEEANKHDVKPHERRLSSGKIVPVKEYERRNPTFGLSRKSNLDEVSHVVYQAFDHTGSLRYIGEGRENRPQHVNSGASHNFKLNEHFFVRGPMKVEVIATGLSKSEALAIEYLLIKKNSGAGLWNIKDYEPELEQ